MAGLRFATFLLITVWLALTAAALSPAEAQRSPFAVPEAQPAAPATTSPQAPSAYARFWHWVQTTQQDLHRRLAAAVRRLKSEGAAAAWLLVSLSFFYGVVHAVGPGHGKAVISSYVLANERTVRRGIVLSFLAAVVQALSAIVLVTLLAIILNAAGLRIKDTIGELETASYALIALIGAWMLFGQMRRLWRPSLAAHAHDHAHHDHAHHDHHAHDGQGSHAHDDACCDHAHMPDPAELGGDLSIKKAAAIVLAVGIRPCTGAVIVLVFALAHGLFLAGVGATFAMALGTAITVSVLAALAVGSKQVALRFAGGSARWTGWISQAAGLGGSALVLLLGLTLFTASLGPARPF